MKIRTATMDDLNEIANVEAECFPAAEAATKEEFAGRIRYYGNHFWIMLEEDKLIAFVDGFVTDEADLTDEMYEKAAMHNEDGAWQMIFGVNMLMCGKVTNDNLIDSSHYFRNTDQYEKLMWGFSYISFCLSKHFWESDVFVSFLLTASL